MCQESKTLYNVARVVRSETAIHKNNLALFCHVSNMEEDCYDPSGFLVYLFIVFSAFPHLFYTKMLYLESLRVTKSYFGIEVLTFRACQGNLSHFSN